MMKQIKTTCILLLLLSCFYIVPSKALTIVGKLKPYERITLFYGGEKMFRIVNNSANDTTIIGHIFINTLTEFRYGVTFSKDNKEIRIRHTLLLSPTDSLVFMKDGNELIPLNRTPNAIFLDQHIEAGYYTLLEGLTKKIITNAEFERYIGEQNKKFDSDSLKIDSLYRLNVIGKEEVKNWTKFRKISLIAKVFQIAENDQIVKPISKIYQNFFNQALNDVNYPAINGDLIEVTLGYLSNYWIKQNNNTSKIKPVDFIDFYLGFRNKIAAEYINDVFIRYIKNFPDKTNINYISNRERIERYAKLYDQKLNMEVIELEKKELFDIKEVKLVNSNNLNLNLKEIADKISKKYLLIDIWASWCAPCRQQMPSFQKFKKDFADKDIAFISVSTDKNENDWLNAMKDEGMYFQQHQYRLENSTTSALTNFFNIATIPRYLILDRDGTVINDRFYLPTDNEFKPALLKLLN